MRRPIKIAKTSYYAAVTKEAVFVGYGTREGTTCAIVEYDRCPSMVPLSDIKFVNTYEEDVALQEKARRQAECRI